jgi:hypothetical protein
MEGDIIYAFIQELKSLVGDTGSTILLRTNWKRTDMPTYKMPLVLIDIHPTGECMQLIGGLTMMDYDCAFSVYNYQQGTPEDPTDYSATRINNADAVRQHFSDFSNFNAAQMASAFNTYGMRLSFQGAGAAEPLETENGLAMGRAWHFSVTAFDNSTTGSQYKTQFNDLINGTQDH